MDLTPDKTKTTKVITQDRPIPTARVGSADIVGFGQYGTVILRHGSSQPVIAVKDFGYNAGGWRVDKHVRLAGDITGNGRSDIVGFGNPGVLISVNNADGTFAPPKRALKNFGYDEEAGSWRVDKHIRYLADTQKSGRCDIVGFGDAGVLLSKNKGDTSFDSPFVALAQFGYNTAAGGWRLDRHLRFMGDTMGNGFPDIVGFHEETVVTSVNNGDGSFEPPQAVIHDLCYNKGWRVDKHPRFIADLTGDGKVDVIGCGDQGLHVSLNKGNSGFGPVKIALKEFGTAQGWEADKHPRYVADLTGNGQGDIIGFKDDGVWVARGNGDGTFREAAKVLNHFGFNQGWRVSKHPRFVVDLTGDGCADIIGFGDTDVYVSFNNGKGGFMAVKTFNREFAYNNGEWGVDNTVRWLVNL